MAVPTCQPRHAHAQVHNIYQTNPAVFIKNLTQHLMFQHCQPMRNHDTEPLQEGNRKINSEKVSGPSSSIQLVHPFNTMKIIKAFSVSMSKLKSSSFKP